ncbi:epidermal growth factor receptor kinase substrate 8 isoform X2 [Nematostella vectensis]|uniref:epidermal growth factor receptor kinase substrate 8 isoform X2 n=1 Tax=Nematostella vectensis TaxID=45351 RepID=UPI0020771D06|nr:epidermal growth factor receptor kinase substrate 8 isoform X2 [Nematostella vectensis]
MSHKMVNGGISSGKHSSPKTSIKNGGINAPRSANQFPARTNFLLEHLASFTLKTAQESQISAKERLVHTKELLAKGNLWTKEMEMRLTDTDIVLLDGETQNVIEVYPLASIGTVQHISDDTDLNSVLLFSTLQTDDKYAATHLFQSDRVPAAVVATEIMKASSSKEAMPSRPATTTTTKNVSALPPPPSYTAPQPPIDRERMDLHERSLVAQTIAAFSVHSQSNIKKPSRVPRGSSQGDGEQEDSNSLEALEARTNRDVQILNHCIDDIENLVWRTKRSAEAWKKLQKKKGKVKADSQLALEARPPPEADFVDAFQKFKHAFNLLARLRQHIHNPNASELVHYLFVPLSLLIRCTNGPDKAKAVLSPLLTTQAIELLQNCLSSKESELWNALGPHWTETKSSKRFKDVFIPPYAPIFKDGWVPPEYVGGKDVPANISAAVAANAAAVAQMNDTKRGDDSGPTSPTVLAAAAKFRRLASIKNENDKETTPSSTPGKRGIFRRTTVLYDFQARNSRELSVKQNEELVVLDDSRQWWCVRNSEGAIGFIPNTVVQANNEQGLSQKDKAYLPAPPSSPPPPIPTATVTITSSSSMEKVSSETRKLPRVELRHVEVHEKLVARQDDTPIPPPPPMSPPPPTPPPPATSPVTKLQTTTTKTDVDGVSEFEKAILTGGNLKKVDKEAEAKRKEEAQKKRLSSADMLNDELKRRMTQGSGTLTPRPTHKAVKAPEVTLTADSGPDEVAKWLRSKNFSQGCMAALQWNSAKDLDKMSKEDLKLKCGDSEGARVFSQFAVQKATWQTTCKGAELQFIMQRRKHLVEVETKKEEPSEEGNLRNLVAEARAAAEEPAETQRTKSVSRPKPIMAAAPQERVRPQSMVDQPVKKPKSPPPGRKQSRGLSFGSEEIVPPPDFSDNPGEMRGAALSPDQVEEILKEQKKQQELLMEHKKQFALLEQLQRQKQELEDYKREFQQQLQRQKQTELEDKQSELEKKIKSQENEMRENQMRLEQQKMFMNVMLQQHHYQQHPQMTAMQPQYQPLLVPPPPQFLPMSPAMAPIPTMQPVMGYSPTVVPTSGVPQMVPTYAVSGSVMHQTTTM